MRLYLLRHGETVYNASKNVQGWVDVPLSAKGKRQAERLHNTLADVRFDRIFSSDVYRVRQTGEIVFPDRYVPFEYDERLREVNNTMWSGLSVPKLKEDLGPACVEAFRHLDFGDFGGEAYADVIDRVRDFMHDLESDTESDKVAVLTHGGVIQAFIANVLGYRYTDTRAIYVGNCTVTVIDYNDGAWRLLSLGNRYELR